MSVIRFRPQAPHGESRFRYSRACACASDLAEPLGDPEPRSGRWWTRAELVDPKAPLAADSRALAACWATGGVAVAEDTPWSRPGWHAAALAWIAAAAGPR